MIETKYKGARERERERKHERQSARDCESEKVRKKVQEIMRERERERKTYIELYCRNSQQSFLLMHLMTKTILKNGFLQLLCWK
jgi:hypothetical protein